MINIYKLQIQCPDIISKAKLNAVIGVEDLNKKDDVDLFWTYEVTQNENEPYFDFINEFVDFIERNVEEIEKLGITRNDISIWWLYGYEQQCNIELNPKRMQRLVEAGITLCISCWED